MATIGRPRNTEADFWPLVSISKPNGCWPFKGTVDKDGYGKFRLIPESLAHRVAYLLKVGPIPKGAHVLHSCDNPPCCNPSHLFLGSPSINMKDMWDKRRHKRPAGENNNHAKLVAVQVLEIRRLNALGHTQVALAKHFGVTQTNISMIVRRETWTEI